MSQKNTYECMYIGVQVFAFVPGPPMAQPALVTDSLQGRLEEA